RTRLRSGKMPDQRHHAPSRVRLVAVTAVPRNEAWARMALVQFVLRKWVWFSSFCANGFGSVRSARMALVQFVLPDFNGGPLKTPDEWSGPSMVHRIPP